MTMSSSPSSVRSATYLSSGTPSRPHFALVKRLEEAAALQGGAYQHALDSSMLSLARDLATLNPSSDANGLYKALMPVSYLRSIGQPLAKAVKETALLPTLQLLSSTTASAQHLHLAWSLLPALLSRTISEGDSSDDDDDDREEEASRSLLLLSTLLTHLGSPRPLLIEQSLRSLASGFPSGPDILPALLHPIRSLAYSHPNARCRARALEAWFKLVEYHDDASERGAAKEKVEAFVLGRFSDDDDEEFVESEGKSKGKERPREYNSRRRLEPCEAATCLRILEQALSTSPSHQKASEALDAVRALLMRIELSLRSTGAGARVPTVLLELCSRVAQQATHRLEAGAHSEDIKRTASGIATSVVQIWSTLISSSQSWTSDAQRSHTSSVSSSASASTLRSGFGVGVGPSSIMMTASKTSPTVPQGQLLSVSISLASILGSLEPLLNAESSSTLASAWAGEAQGQRALLIIQASIHSLLSRQNANARLACVKVLRSLVPFGWAKSDGSGAGGDSEVAGKDESGEQRFRWSSLLREKHWEALLGWIDVGDEVLRKETLHLLALVDVGILQSYQASLLGRASSSGASPPQAQAQEEEVARLQCRALEVGIIIASSPSSSSSSATSAPSSSIKPSQAQDHRSERRQSAIKAYVDVLLALFANPPPASSSISVGPLLTQARADLGCVEERLASQIMLRLLGQTVQLIKGGSEREEGKSKGVRMELLLLCAILAFEFPFRRAEDDDDADLTTALDTASTAPVATAPTMDGIVPSMRSVVQHLCELLSIPGSSGGDDLATVRTSLLVALFGQVCLLSLASSVGSDTSIGSCAGSTKRLALAAVARLTEAEQEAGRGEGEVGKLGAALLRLMRDDKTLWAVGRRIGKGVGLSEARERILNGQVKVTAKVGWGRDDEKGAEKLRQDGKAHMTLRDDDNEWRRTGQSARRQSKQPVSASRKPLRYAAYGDDEADVSGSTTVISSSTTSGTSRGAAPSVFLAARSARPPVAPSSREGGRLMRRARREEERLWSEAREGVRRLVLGGEEDDDEGGEGEDQRAREEMKTSSQRGRERERAELEKDDKETRKDRSDSLTSRPDLILFDADAEGEGEEG